jgi:Thioredoxin-like
MYAHERSLVKRLENKPFVLLGVNTDSSRDELKRAIADNKLTWCSWWDGPGGPIVRKWGIQGFPTMILIDHKGNVRGNIEGVPSATALDRAIDKLVAEAESDQGTNP